MQTDEFTLFWAGLAVLVLAVLALSIGPKNIVEFFKTAEDENGKASPRRGVLAALLVALVVTLLLSLTGCASYDSDKLRWVPYGYAEFGLDTPIKGKPSPQCEEGDNQWASMITISQAVFMYGSVEGHIWVNHQSCATAKDTAVEDTWGVSMRYLWGER